MEQAAYFLPFSHIYIEKDCQNRERTRRILSHFREAETVEIAHYKDIFNRRGQTYAVQHKTQNLILAENRGELVYPGAPVCQNFGNAYFYYASTILNCPYDCEYCYLKGMYPSGNMVVFVNLEDYFHEVDRLLKKHPVYLCISYDADLLATEFFTGYVQEWMDFAKDRKDLTIEIRTKCARKDWLDREKPPENVIFAFTISPQEVIEKYEHRTPDLALRLSLAKELEKQGTRIRLCFDPMIYLDNWQKKYSDMLKTVGQQIDLANVRDISVGTFRMPQEYLKAMRKAEPASAVVQYPYETHDKIAMYDVERMREMENFLIKKLEEVYPAKQIFTW